MIIDEYNPMSFAMLCDTESVSAPKPTAGLWFAQLGLPLHTKWVFAVEQDNDFRAMTHKGGCHV
ncbi:MAG: hypothetical protein RIF33_03620 [Cyclobacteriaceae bacterium]